MALAEAAYSTWMLNHFFDGFFEWNDSTREVLLPDQESSNPITRVTTV